VSLSPRRHEPPRIVPAGAQNNTAPMALDHARTGVRLADQGCPGIVGMVRVTRHRFRRSLRVTSAVACAIWCTPDHVADLLRGPVQT
jgi:hypothetical protein